MTEYIFFNNKLIAKSQAKISIQERGFLFGDGIFETCRIFGGRIYDYKSHEARIKRGLSALKIAADIFDLEKKCQKLIIKNKLFDGLLRLSITRGIGSNGYLPINTKSLIIIETLPLREIPKKISLSISKIKKSNFLNSYKTNNALPFILNKIAANEEGFFDAIMLTNKNFISETSSANIFWAKKNKIYTASKACNIMPGTVREKLLKISPYKISEKKARVSELKKADEVFLTNSSFMVAGVDEISFGKDLTKKYERKYSKILAKILQDDVRKN